jgi:site-specific DNA-methyltransferase (cytosine-N4-specific)
VLKGWQIDEGKVRELLGLSVATANRLSNLSALGKAFLLALASMDGEEGPFPANQVMRLAQAATPGLVVPEKSLESKVIQPLVRAAFVTAERGTAGRGARASMVEFTEKLTREILEPILEQVSRGEAELVRFLRIPLSELIVQVDEAPTKGERGLALEALAIRLMRHLGCTYIGTRIRNVWTGGAEVDALFEHRGVFFSRVQVQAKNTARVDVHDVAKEVGVAQSVKATIVVMVTTGTIGDVARDFAATVMRVSNVAIYLIDGRDLKAIGEDASAIVDVFQREAVDAAKLKETTD